MQRLLVVCAAVGAVAVALPPPLEADRSADVGRARASYAAMQKFFYDARSGLYAPTYPRVGRQRYAHVWPFSQALAATVSVAQIDGRSRSSTAAVRARLQALGRYWNRSTRPAAYDAEVLDSDPDQYYDDNAWVGLELLRIHRMSGDRFALARAKRVFSFVTTGWDADTTHACPGGIFWMRGSAVRDRNTVSTANAAQLAALLFGRTHDPHYLVWATTMYDWVTRCLTAANGLFADHIGLTGAIEPTQWSYNQGAMIGAAALLYRATRDRAYVVQAERVADAAIAAYLPYEQSREPPYFLAIFFQDLWLLETVDPVQNYEAAVAAYADQMWRSMRDPRTGLFSVTPGKPVQLLEQAALVRIYAELADASA
jgi:predicted alpha-1,6-mannanase (GH76 family)